MIFAAGSVEAFSQEESDGNTAGSDESEDAPNESGSVVLLRIDPVLSAAYSEGMDCLTGS